MSTSPPSPRSGPDQRRTARIVCSIPVGVVSPEGWPRARVIDLSRTGVRLGIPLVARRDAREEGLGGLAALLREHLAVKVTVEFHPERLGSLIRRDLHVVRVGPVDDRRTVLELGCELVPPLEEDEAAALGVPLPREGEPPDVARRRMGEVAPAPQGPSDPWPAEDPAVPLASAASDRVPRPAGPRRARRGLRCALASQLDAARKPLRGHVLELSEEGGLLCVEDRTRGRLFPPSATLADRVVAVARAFGAVADLDLRQERRSYWTGPVRIASVGVIPEVPGQLLLGFTFADALDEGARRTIRGLQAA